MLPLSMNNLTVVKNNKPVVCSDELAKGFMVEHRALRQLIKKHKEKLSKYGKVTFQMQASKSGQNQSVTYLNEKQAMLIMTYTRSNEATDYFRMKLIDDFAKQKDLISSLLIQKNNINWKDIRRDGKVLYFQKTDVIKNFVDYAIKHGSRNAKMYYMNLAKMENNALFFLEQKYPNVREFLTIKQLMQVATADQIIENTLTEGIKNEIPYKEIFKMAKENVQSFGKILGKSPILEIEE